MSRPQEDPEEFDVILARLQSLLISEKRIENKEEMNSENLQVLLDTAIQQAVQRTKESFEATIADLTRRLQSLEPPSAVEAYKEIEIVPNKTCEETLDIIKSVPEFKGDPTRYVSWRQAATTAHKLFEPYVGSSKYYQAVAILRNKVVGNADAALSTYNTVLNFKAIIARLDFTYMDKKSIFTLEQELSTLRQGQKTIIQFYDEVERKLTAIVNKIIMSNEGDANLIQSLNQKYREQALRVFVSGVRKPLCDTLFSCKPADLPSALALAQELEANQNRYHFAAIYSNGLNKASMSPSTHTALRQNIQHVKQNSFGQQNNYSQPPQNFVGQQTTPFYQNRPQQASNQSQRHNVANSNFRNFAQNPFQPVGQQASDSQPVSQSLDTDVSMRTVRTNNFQGFQTQKRGLTSERQVPQKVQRINHLGQEMLQNEGLETLETHDYGDEPNFSGNQEPYENPTFSDPPFEDEINFLREGQFSPTLSE